MRFISGGIDLPDELLNARDAGELLLFCGAGISQAQAWLPNFPVLARNVLQSLGSALDSPARRLFEASGKLEKISGLTGLIATDRIFGMLEQEFHPSEVREAMAVALRPPTGYGLGAHRTILDLARTREGVTRLVTTNFDRLFEECDGGLASHFPPRLPDPRRDKDFRGVVHIHGMVDQTYSRTCDDEIVLSSADFGRAYLADGWATRYIQLLLERYKILFIGYSADDPPVQYLLEALNQSGTHTGRIFAFQAGDSAQAVAQWAHKGVLPIAYSPDNGHRELWETLDAWAERSRDVDAWYERLIVGASRGPEVLDPAERGRVVNLAATHEGARRLALSARSLPATWLNVLDPARRYANPDRTDLYDDDSPRFDPFNAYGLDRDEAPEIGEPDNRWESRKMPADAWDAFVGTEIDRGSLGPDAVAQFRRHGDPTVKLSPRLWQLGMLVVDMAHQPAALWWAAQQSGLHPSICGHLLWKIRREPENFPAVVRDGWRLLIASWDERKVDVDGPRYDIDARVTAEGGWTSRMVREAITLYRPRIRVAASYGVKAPELDPEPKLGNIVRVEIEYPRPHLALSVPDEHLALSVELFAENIAHAIRLHQEVNPTGELYFDSTRPDDGEEADEDAFQFTGHLNIYLGLVARLARFDRAAARAVFARWPTDVDAVHTRLRIWAAGRPELLDPDEAADIFLSLPDDDFWTFRQERDLLFAIRDRWTDMSLELRRRVEERFISSPIAWLEDREDRELVDAHSRLNRLQWLRDRGIGFDDETETVAAALMAFAADWEPRFAAHTAQPQVGEAYSIETDTDTAMLEDVPLSEILGAARNQTGHDFERRVDKQPFKGLVAKRPVRALAALSDAARRSQFDKEAWRTLLHAEAEALRAPRMLRQIANRLLRLSESEIAEIRFPISEWLRDVAEPLMVTSPRLFGDIWDRIVGALAANPPAEKFRRSNASWVEEGLNQPPGRLVDALFKDPARHEFKSGEGLGDIWRARLDQLLSLPGSLRHQALAIIAARLNWLFEIDPDWTLENLIPAATAEGADALAFWGGYFWPARVPQGPLYSHLKPAFVALARGGLESREQKNKLAGMLLAGWKGAPRANDEAYRISDVELREILIHADDELRSQTLGYLIRWPGDPDSGWGDCVIPFLRDVWPRQLAVRTPRTSARLVDLAVSNPERFTGVAELILPWLTTVESGSFLRLAINDADQELINKHPATIMDIIWAVLPADPNQWPYETEKILVALEETEVRNDERLAELRRRYRLR